MSKFGDDPKQKTSPPARHYHRRCLMWYGYVVSGTIMRPIGGGLEVSKFGWLRHPIAHPPARRYRQIPEN
eukprot:gene18555-biopygen5501